MYVPGPPAFRHADLPPHDPIDIDPQVHKYDDRIGLERRLSDAVAFAFTGNTLLHLPNCANHGSVLGRSVSAS